MEQILYEARAIFRHLVITRKWISDHQGVFVEKLPGVKANPYLKNIEAEITAQNGKTYVRKNPAMVTRELSDYAKEKGLFWFNITSLNLINPENKPDEFERDALLLFEQNKSNEQMAIVTKDNTKYFRYISPLYIEDSCMGCHVHQGYKIGDVRGAISITIPIDNTFSYIDSNNRNILIGGIFTLLSLIVGLSLLIKKLILKPLSELKSSIDDFSNGIYNPQREIKSGDELEELYKSFASMARTLQDYHHSLNDKIKAATKDVELTNARLLEMNSLLQEANLRKSDFIARASHELRTPLTSIKGAIDYINARYIKGSNYQQISSISDEFLVFLDIIKNNVDRLIRMVNDMLDIERIEQGKSELNLVDVKPEDLIRDLVYQFSFEAQKKNIRFDVYIDCDFMIKVDEERIKQVLSNLFINAIKFSPVDSLIKVEAVRKDGCFHFEVCDQCQGIEVSKQYLIFEKFYKLGSKEGAGLGLSICKSIIEAHGGKIGVHSNGKDGCCFYFDIPLELKIKDNTKNEK
ncbi:MAG: DUF3365 domain-containing protein [Thermodesulfovibrionales bacterium]|nr:DUF3365 domain-containing protein [Thermodesulfovibrionales bacterium]